MLLCSVAIGKEIPVQPKKNTVKNQMRELKGEEKMQFLRSRGFVLTGSAGKKITNNKLILQTMTVKVGSSGYQIEMSEEAVMKGWYFDAK